MAEWVAGRIPVLECLRAGRRTPYRLCALDGAKGIGDILKAARGLPVEPVDKRTLDKLVPNQVHQGVVLEAAPLPRADLRAWIETAPADALALVLDEIEDPHNFGAIVRSASAFGAHGVVFGVHRSAPLSVAAQKAAAGAMEYVDLIEETNLAQALDTLKQAGFWVAGLDAEGDVSLWDADMKGRVALVVGNEGRGLRRLVRKHCDYLARIPIGGPISSLNASVSAAVALAEWARQRSV